MTREKFITRLADEIYNGIKLKEDWKEISIGDILIIVNSDLQNRYQEHIKEHEIWFIQSIVLCKIKNIKHIEEIELEEYRAEIHQTEGALIEINPIHKNKYWQGVTKISYNNLYPQILYNIFTYPPTAYNLDSFDIFDVRELFLLVYDEYTINKGLILHTEAHALKKWINYLYGISTNYDITNPWFFPLFPLWQKSIREVQAGICKTIGEDLIYFDTDTAWLRKDPSHIIRTSSIYNFYAEKIKHFVLLGKKKYIESNDDNFKIKGIR